VSVRIRAGSRFKQFLCFVLIDVRYLRVLPGVHVPQTEDHCSRGHCFSIINLLQQLVIMDFWSLSSSIQVKKMRRQTDLVSKMFSLVWNIEVMDKVEKPK
jgi:hypothetical protein